MTHGVSKHKKTEPVKNKVPFSVPLLKIKPIRHVMSGGNLTFGKGFIQAASSFLIDHDFTKSLISSRFRPISANVLSSRRFSEETAVEYSNQAFKRPRKVDWLSFAASFVFVINLIPFINEDRSVS